MRPFLTFFLVFPLRSYRLHVFPPDRQKNRATYAISDPNRRTEQPE